MHLRRGHVRPRRTPGLLILASLLAGGCRGAATDTDLRPVIDLGLLMKQADRLPPEAGLVVAPVSITLSDPVQRAQGNALAIAPDLLLSCAHVFDVPIDQPTLRLAGRSHRFRVLAQGFTRDVRFVADDWAIIEIDPPLRLAPDAATAPPRVALRIDPRPVPEDDFAIRGWFTIAEDLAWRCRIPARAGTIARDDDGTMTFLTGIDSSFRSLSGSPIVVRGEDGERRVIGIFSSSDLVPGPAMRQRELRRRAAPLPDVLVRLARAGRLWVPVIDAEGTRHAPGIAFPGPIDATRGAESPRATAPDAPD